MVGSMVAMPLIVINMGGEMVYILNQRLQAQSVQDEKSKKVLQDVMKAMYSPLFIQELFKPQEMYTSASTKQIFEKLAHSSIMRLNKSSMDKLYDLMTMGFKRQIVTCPSPQHYLMVTLNHLESLKKLVDNPQVHELIQEAIKKTITTYSTLTSGQWMVLKQCLMRYLQDKKVKVSLFLQQNLQASEGTLILKNEGNLPYGTEKPGYIRVLEGGSVVNTRTFELDFGGNYGTCDEPIDTGCVLGLNMYNKSANAASTHADEKTSPSSSFAQAVRSMLASGTAGASGLPSVAGAKDSKSAASTGASISSPTRSTAKAELTLLADLLGVAPEASAKESKRDTKGFRINLFPDPIDAKGAEGKGGDDYHIINFDIDARADAKSMARYMEEFDLLDDEKPAAKGADDEDDLLDLMDSVK